MRATDDATSPPAAVQKRHRAENMKSVAGLVIAAAGLVVVFKFEALVLGFAVAMVGAGIVPFGEMADRVWPRGGQG